MTGEKPGNQEILGCSLAWRGEHYARQLSIYLLGKKKKTKTQKPQPSCWSHLHRWPLALIPSSSPPNPHHPTNSFPTPWNQYQSPYSVSSSLVPVACFSTSKSQTPATFLPRPHSPPLTSLSLPLCQGSSSKLSLDPLLPIHHLIAPVSASWLLLQQCLLSRSNSLPPPGPSFSALHSLCWYPADLCSSVLLGTMGESKARLEVASLSTYVQSWDRFQGHTDSIPGKYLLCCSLRHTQHKGTFGKVNC